VGGISEKMTARVAQFFNIFKSVYKKQQNKQDKKALSSLGLDYNESPHMTNYE
jgi:hypothetical protein